MKRRVVITGLGTINPLGNTVDDFWRKIKNAENGIGPITYFNPVDFTSKIAGEIKDLHLEDYMDKREARRMDKFALYAVIASEQAWKDSGFDQGGMDPEKVGVVLGNGIGGIETLGDNFRKLFDRGPKGIHPLLAPMMIINIAGANVAIKINAMGPCHTVCTACASGTDALGEAYRWIADGEMDAMVAGGTEACVTTLGLGSFTALQAVSTNNEHPEQASRPFDKDRDGFVIGEGSGMLVIEELEHAKKRGVRIYAELAGYGASCDANHLTAPHPEGRGAVLAMKAALDSAGMKPEDLDYINAHGTSTPINDPVETKAIKKVFGEHARKLKISSTKSMTGHLLGAAGGVEAVVVAKSLQDQFYPATRNLDNPDPECDLNFLPHKGIEAPMHTAFSNSFGFGGHNGVLAFKRYDG